MSEIPLEIPRVPPRTRTPSPFRRFFLLARNPLLVVPEAAYQEPIVRTERKPWVAYVCGPDLVNEVLLERRNLFPKDPIQKGVLAPLTGNGILTSEGEDWRWQRRTVAPLFRQRDVLQFVPAMVASANFIIEAWSRRPVDETRMIDSDMVRTAYHVIASTLLPSDHDRVTASIEENAGGFGVGLPWAIAMLALKFPAWAPHPGKRDMARHAATLRRLVADMIAERRASPIVRDDLFNRLLNATDPETGASMSDEQLVDNLLTFLMAGHDTTAKALTWALYLLARAPDWQERLVAEIREVAGERPIDGRHVAELTTLQRFVKEAMRLFPPVPTLTRIAAIDVELGGVALSAGTLIVIPTYVIHRHRALWDHPDRFDPDRFLPEKERAFPRNKFMPFGAGPRICIGAAFAQAEVTVVLATLIRAVRFSGIDEGEPMPVARIVLLPDRPVRLRVTPR